MGEMQPQSSQQPPPQDTTMTTMLYRLQLLESQLKQVQDQLQHIRDVPMRENELQLAAIQASVNRMERDVVDMKAKQESIEIEARRDIEERKRAEENLKLSQANLQLRAMWAILVGIGTVAGGVFINYASRGFH